MPRDVENEPGLAPSADTHAEKSEKVRAGKGAAGVLGGVALAFVLGFVVIIVGALLFGLHIL